MSALRLILEELLGLFLDDLFLAIATLAVIALAAIASYGLHQPLLAGIILLAGCIAALAISAVREK